MSEFKKESRYIVVKIKDLQSNSMKKQGDFYAGLERLQLPKRHYVCIESDWPEYDLVWKMIQDRVEGKPNEMVQTLRAQLADAEKKLASSGPVVYQFADETLGIPFTVCSEETFNKLKLEDTPGLRLRILSTPQPASASSEPVATIHDDGYWTHPAGRDPLDSLETFRSKKSAMHVYAAPQPATVRSKPFGYVVMENPADKECKPILHFTRPEVDYCRTLVTLYEGPQPISARPEPIGEVTASAVRPEESGLYRHEFLSAERIPVQAELYIAPQLVPEDQWQKLFNQVALILKCLPSAFVDDNAHVIQTAERLMQPAPDTQAAAECGQMVRDMANRFLSWKLPKDFNPDAGISFNPTDFQKANDHAWPVGTNLFTETQAEDMVGFIAAKVVAGAIMAKNEWTAFQPYLKDGESPIMRLEREVADCQSLLSLLASEKKNTNAAVAAALEKAAAIARNHISWSDAADDDDKQQNQWYENFAREIDAIPRDTSALDEYKADIKRLGDALESVSNEIGIEDWYELLAELKAKYNL